MLRWCSEPSTSINIDNFFGNQVTKLPDESNETAVRVIINLGPDKTYLKHMDGVVVID